ncbi:carboxylating nicotinate-nucleotide diphosphorylase [Psychroflexus sp. ALD_RP9]|uniref:carboxylating nicotinate-nucleotide diphosphorylase n=1 Tax=Psychroflexus sp. ALD_RP9 TaxID=2777186 RepID=UPI001A8F00E8|nr:carboxylating nicotinate-nucleotide diphosphorylase [Psychroflexus sp. ALD_RP9]QSS96965.1 carboxylating nicotinate-nucleotide diphosphorylase [Psychroflexus sp. ALD_RP9]
MISQHQLDQQIQQIIINALKEDVGDGDHSSLACIPAEAEGKAQLLVKDEGIIAGIDIAQKVFQQIDSSLDFNSLISDGNAIKHGDIAFTIYGKHQNILKGERIALNIMQRMSAIATKTKQFVDLLKPYKTQILDTRKTTPGIRAIEKLAVKIGGGTNHRYALYDMIMLKDNHIDFAGGITKAINKTVNYLKNNQLDLKIIVEARDLAEVEEILKSSQHVERILLDNFSYIDTQKAVNLIGSACKTESSGGITPETAVEFAKCGVDYISSGALTHSIYNLDLSLKAV